MLKFALLLVLPCLIAADMQCDGGKHSCPDDKTCCTVDGKSACCDAGQLPKRSSLLSAPNNATIQNGMFDNECNFMTCSGTCCNKGANGCCPIQLATCCSGDNCCEFGSTCCGEGCCDISFPVCCSSWCCKRGYRCGLSHMSCYSAAEGLNPTTLVTLVAVWAAIYAMAKM